MDSISVPQLIANVSFGGGAAVVAVLTAARLGLLYKGGRTRQALAEILEAGIISVALLFFIIQPFLGKTFYIPSGSMIPTLSVNDHIIVDKLTPRFQMPNRGSVVVFVAPQSALEDASDPDEAVHNSQPIDYIKRLIGLPGDIVVVHHGYITINGQSENHAAIRRVLNLTDPNHQHVKIEQNDLIVTNGTVTRYNASQIAQLFNNPGAAVEFHPGETIRNGVVLSESYIAEDPSYDFKLVDGHSVRVDPDNDIRFDGVDPNRAEMKLIQERPACPVPQNSILVFGDNRNDSNDSTIWGPLDNSRLVGRAISIFWPINRIRTIN